ncbi:hypothetical protein P4B35_05810 [Pontiellaceae bacterium B12227]|nr:hypothetical protein [Pontiellaceae bacterium B12227]
MKLTRLQTYCTGWMLYLAFIFILFPQLKITVLLFSIPLSMLGGWLYKYKGAFATTLFTIPLHYILLTVYSDDQQLINEAFNPFGISSQLIFSCCTALLRASQLKYKELNNSLEDIVKERTRDLEELTTYLIESQQYENRELNASLLEKPYQELKTMLATSQLLKQKLNSENHPRAMDAENISMIISSCIKQLRSIDNYTFTDASLPGRISDSIETLMNQVEEVSEIDIQCIESPEWETLPEHTAPRICEIIFEAVSNALRHAEPNFIHIGIEKAEGTTLVFIENDGKPLPTAIKEGMGVPLMRYRAGKIGATCAIHTLPSGKTRVECRIPEIKKTAH